MNRTKHIIGALVLGAAFLTSCSDDITTGSLPNEVQGTGMPVLFSAGNQSLEGASRAATTIYMPNKVRFSAAMYYQESAHYNLTPWLAYLQVDDKGAGNSNYRQYTFVPPVGKQADNYGNDLDSHIFYWQNRQDHIFIGYIDNYNAAYASAKASTQTYTPDKLENNDLFDIIENKEVVRQQKCKHFDLRNPKVGDEYQWTKMSDQYDPLIACTEKQPTGSGGETNRVYLTFKHQFSQIQVNLKGHESVNLIADQIDAVELLGVSESADVFPYVDYKVETPVTPETPGDSGDSETPGTPETPETPDSPEDPSPSTNATIVLYSGSYIRPAEAGKVDLTQYTDEQIEANPHGTSFGTFLADDVSAGYLKRFEAIAYGQLQALRIHWHELKNQTDETGNEVHDSEGNPIKVKGIEHNVTFAITDANFRELKSGKRYVFNLEIRRGTLAIVRTVIDDWVPYENTYNVDGTINE